MKDLKFLLVILVLASCKDSANQDSGLKNTNMWSEIDQASNNASPNIADTTLIEPNESLLSDTNISVEKEVTTVPIKMVGGVYMIPVEVDETAMEFVFDTGAGIISISEVEAAFLYKQGKISNEDILGLENFSDANGNISEGTIINLKTVKIGDRILNDVQASVVPNQRAPLLLGQTALSRFGKVTIDYNNNELILE